MQDILLWQKLESEATDSTVLPHLEQLATNSLRDRFAFFAAIEYLHDTEQAALRRAALAVLAGASGHVAQKHIVRALSDSDAEVRKQAVASLKESVQSDHPRLAHALFHPLPDVRRYALTAIQDTNAAWYSLMLCEDAANANEAKQTALGATHLFKQSLLPIIVGLAAKGSLTDLEAIELVFKIRTDQWAVAHSPKNARSHELVKRIATDFEVSDPKASLEERIKLSGTDILDTVVELLFRNLESQNTISSTELGHASSSPTSEQITEWFRRLLDDALQPGLIDAAHHFAYRVWASILRATKSLGQWTPPALEWAAVCAEFVLSDTAIPRAQRRSAVGVLYQLRSRRRGLEAGIRKLLHSDLARRDNGHLDLWAIGGLLHRVDHPYRMLLDTFKETQITAAFLADPSDSAIMFSLPDSGGKDRVRLVNLIRGQRASETHLVTAILVFSLNSDGFDFLSNLEAKEAIGLVEQIHKLEVSGKWKLTDARRRTAARFIAPKLIRHLKDFIQRWFQLDQPHKNALGVEILGNLTAEFQGSDFAEMAATLSDTEIRKLIDVIPYCAGFPYGHEMALALKLQSSKDDAIAQWAIERVPAAHPEPSAEPLPDVGSPLTPNEIKQIVAARSESQLQRALQPALENARSGVARALAGQAPPTSTSPAACCALLGCTDPLREVDVQFVRFCGAEPEVGDLNQVEAEMVAKWATKEKDVWLIGNAWLHRWERHLFAFGERAADQPETLIDVLRLSQALTSALLRQQIWEATLHLLQVYRARIMPRFLQLMTDDLLQTYIRELQSDIAVFAAKIIMMFHEHHGLCNKLTLHRDDVSQLSFDLAEEVRSILEPWISSAGVVSSSTARVLIGDLDEAERQEIRRCTDIPSLVERCRSKNSGAINESTLRLVELGDAGQQALADLLLELPLVAGYSFMAESISLWDHEPSLARLRTTLDDDIRMATDSRIPRDDGQRDQRPQRIFALGLAFVEQGDERYVDDVLAATAAEGNWFLGNDWSRLIRAVLIERVNRTLVVSPQPHAYRHSVEYLLAQPHGDEVSAECLCRFLLCGSNRHATLRYRVAEWLLFSGEPMGLPILIREFSTEEKSVNICLGEMSLNSMKSLIDCALQVGGRTFNEKHLLKLIWSPDLDDEAKAYGYLQLSALARSEAIQQNASDQLPSTASRQVKLRKTAQIFHWGIQKGRELTGRLFGVTMIGGSDLGYTRMSENRIYINPIAIFRGVQHGEDIVRGLVVHELGHHMYHRGPVEEKIWDQAFKEGLGPLLNLVADEHLERNLRAISDEYGNQLKRLGAYAFQHSKKEYPVETLLHIFHAHSLSILTKTKMNVAREAASVSIDSGRVLMEAERQGMSFPRFFRALRMGLGNRHNDPLVAKALALFGKPFKTSSMRELYEIAKKLRDIFESEAHLIDGMNQDRMCESSDRDLRGAGEGLDDAEIQSAIRRIERREELGDSGRGTGGERCINVIPEVEFDTISRIQPLAYSREAHERYADYVRAPANRLRRFLSDLGSRYEPVPRRLHGSRLARPLLKKLVIQRDPRVLVARERVVVNDLFLGVIVDCSGSMDFSDNLEKAKRFGMLVAEAAQAVRGIDVRLFGFTDSTIYDAGSAERPAIPALSAGGGNNDAAALWHAAQEALVSKRRAKLLVMISDGLPTECSVQALRALVLKLTHRFNICCAQASVEPLTEECFEHYVLLKGEIDESVREFGSMIAKLVRRAMQNAG